MANRDASFMVMCWTANKASGPSRRISPMWLTSKIPTPLRPALCSTTIPPFEGYWTGISQPSKSTILAPIPRWTALRAVLRRVGVVASTGDKGKPQKAVAGLTAETQYPNTARRGHQTGSAGLAGLGSSPRETLIKCAVIDLGAKREMG